MTYPPSGSAIGPSLLIVSQVFVPDPASVGQHLFDVAGEMGRRGFRVRVITSARGYDDPSRRYPRREIMGAVEVIRLGLASFGKSWLAARVLGSVSFSIQAIATGLRTRGMTHLLVSTSPPLSGLIALVIAKLRDVRLVYWVMDLNPDQAVALGVIRETSLVARCLSWINQRVLARADVVVVMDRYMEQRVLRKAPVASKLVVLPPWAHDDVITPVAHVGNPFRRQHVEDGTRAIMYSGNHTSTNPLTTLLEATRSFDETRGLRFLFVGGGTGKAAVDRYVGPTVRSLPYQPLAELKWSLSAADVHVVTLGENMVGMIHPCKVYSALAVGRPILFIGPRESHVGEILSSGVVGWQVEHGDVDGLIRVLAEIETMDSVVLAAMGKRAQRSLDEFFAPRRLIERFAALVDGSESPAPIRH